MTQHNHNQLSQPAFNTITSTPLSNHNSLTPLHDLISASHLTPQPINWLWHHRIPLAGITLLDGDHGCAKSLLSLQIAAAVSSGSPMPDHTPTTQGSVVIITPHTDPTTTQLQLLTNLGANLAHIYILSFIPDSPASPDFPASPPEPDSNTSALSNPLNPPTLSDPHALNSHPFSLPEDSHALFQAVQRVNARLVIFDPFISLLSRNSRTTNERLCHLLADLNHRFIKQNIACLLIRNCPARGGHAHPSVLERSDHFLTTSVSRLLLTRDPFLSNRLLLCHALSRHAPLTPTLILQTQPFSHNPDLPHLTFLDIHPFQANEFIEYRPDTLHRRLLSQHLLTLLHDPANFISSSHEIPVSTLYAHSPHSSPFQIQRSLKDLLNMGQIERLTRGFYTLASTFNLTSTTSPLPDDSPPEHDIQETIPNYLWDLDCPYPNPTITQLNSTAAITYPIEPPNQLNPTAATTPIIESPNQFNPTATTIPTPNLNTIAATTNPPILNPIAQLNPTAATTPTIESHDQLNPTAATTPTIESPDQLNSTAATTFTLDPHLISQLSPADIALYYQILERDRRIPDMDETPRHRLSQQFPPRKSFWDMDCYDGPF